MSATLLIELFTEELPPKALNRLGEAFAQTIADGLRKRQFLAVASSVRAYATPRRLAVTITEVAAQSPDQPFRKKLLPVSVAFDAEGRPTQALAKKLAAEGIAERDPATLERALDGKAEALFLSGVAAGQSLQPAVQAVLEEALAALPIPKVMSYQLADGETTVHFVRPAHRLTVLHGAQAVAASVLGLQADRLTEGHRFHSQGAIRLEHADRYVEQLAAVHVVAGFAERRERIRRQLAEAAQGDTVVMPDALLDEVTALVEWPCVYEGRFEPEFLEVPQECLILTMQQNQKYFALTDAAGKMRNRFLLVSNLQTDDPHAIVNGNERVLRARLSDARFFFTQDKKLTLESRIPRLDKVVYLAKLGQAGSQLARLERMTLLATELARALGADVLLAERAARLAKADLLTDMVGEFPELQGVMGEYYARHDGEPDEVAQAVREHYQPRFAGDALPATPSGVCVALADKLETLAGLFGLGQQPTGDKDPYALRRHALGVLRILMDKQLALPLDQIVAAAFNVFPEGVLGEAQVELEDFLFDRLRGLLREQGYSANEVEAVVSHRPGRVDLVPAQLAAVRAFAALPEAASLAAANKRIANILKKAEGATSEVDPACFAEDAERALFQALQEARPGFQTRFDSGDYTGALQGLAPLKGPVDSFFDHVMVMAEDARLRTNRIALLAELHRLMNRVADLSKLAA
jgi:glycyl-tRNA synthetase beta chain